MGGGREVKLTTVSSMLAFVRFVSAFVRFGYRFLKSRARFCSSMLAFARFFRTDFGEHEWDKSMLRLSLKKFRRLSAMRERCMDSAAGANGSSSIIE
jgi:hypothetical protein